MENDQTPLGTTTTKKIRPAFLLVLCILSFLGSGGAILNNIYTYFNAKVAAELAQVAVEDTKDKISNSNEANAGTKMAEKVLAGAGDALTDTNFRKSALWGMVASVFTLIGAISMFQLKKNGFWVYLLGTIISIIGPVISFGTGNIVSMGNTLLMCFIGIVFVVLYGLNLKHLR